MNGFQLRLTGCEQSGLSLLDLSESLSVELLQLLTICGPTVDQFLQFLFFQTAGEGGCPSQAAFERRNGSGIGTFDSRIRDGDRKSTV